jgi:hypothetical protein
VGCGFVSRSMRAYKGLTATATSVAFRPEDKDGRGGSGQGSLVCGGEDGVMWLLDAAKAGSLCPFASRGVLCAELTERRSRLALASTFETPRN